MKRLSKHDLHKLTAKQLRDKAPFVVVSDGEDIVAVVPISDIKKVQKSHDVNERRSHDVNREIPRLKENLRELPLSKHKQAQGRLHENR